jgi:hypothetical protein
MKIKFDILNQEIDLTDVFKDENKKVWYFKNCLPKIPETTKIEDLTEQQKISLIRLAIYEGFIEQEDLCNLPIKSYKIHQ